MTTTPRKRGSPDGMPSAAPPSPPRPGHGVVWVNGGDEVSWYPSWQEGPRIQDSPAGTREQAMAWAREFPGEKRLVFSAELNEYVEFD